MADCKSERRGGRQGRTGTLEASPEAEPRLGTAERIGIVWLLFGLGFVAIGMFHWVGLAPRLPFDAARLIRALLAGVFGVSLVAWACRRLDRRSPGSLGFRFDRTDFQAFAIGAGLWAGLAGVGLAVGTGIGLIEVSLVPPTLRFVGLLALQALLVLAYEAIPEEVVMRGYIFTNLAERTPVWVAALGQAVLFSLWAFLIVAILQWMGAEAWAAGRDRLILFFTFGLTLVLLRLWTGSLGASIGFHFAFQVFMQLLGISRLLVLDIPPAEFKQVGVILWFFTIVLGGLIALVGVIRGRAEGRPG